MNSRLVTGCFRGNRDVNENTGDENRLYTESLAKI